MKFDICKDIVSQGFYFKSRPDLVIFFFGGGGLGGGNLKSWKTLRVEGSGWILVGKISTSPRYMIDLTGNGSALFGVVGGGGGGNSEKNEVFLNYERVVGSQWNSIFRRISCLRALILNPDQIWWHWGEVGRGKLKLGKLLEWRDQDETWWEK